MRYFLYIFIFLSSVSIAQRPVDSLFLMTGRVIVAPVTDTLLGAATIIDPDDSTKRVHIENDILYAIKYHNGDMFYYYKQDTISNWFTREEMGLYMQGERDAKKGFKPWGSFCGVMACGIVGGVTGTLFGPVLPALYFPFFGLTKIRIKHNTVSNPNYLDSDAYLLGYEREARTKRWRYVLISAGAGLAAGYAAYFLGVRDLYGPNISLGR